MKNKTTILSLLAVIILFFSLCLQGIAQTEPPEEMQLKVPFIAQENSPNCWAASILMLIEAVRPSTDYNIYRLTYRSGAFDGTTIASLPGNNFIRSEIERRTNQERLAERWTLNSENRIIHYIKKQIGLHKRPVLFCSSASMESTMGAHCVVIVGYKSDPNYERLRVTKGDEITIHNPQNREGNIDIYNKTTWDYIFNREYRADGRTQRPGWNFIPTYVTMVIPAAIDRSSDYNFLKAYFCNKAFSLRSAKEKMPIDYSNNWRVPEGYIWENSRNDRIPESFNELIINTTQRDAINIINTSTNDISLKICVNIETVDGKKRKTLMCSPHFTAHAGQRASCPVTKKIALSDLEDILKKDPKGNTEDYILSVQYFDASNDNLIHTEFIKFPHDPISEGIAKLSAKNTVDNKYKFYIIPDRVIPKENKWKYKFVIINEDTQSRQEIISEKDETEELRLALPGKYRVEAAILKVNDRFLAGEVTNPNNYKVHASDEIKLEVNPFIDITETQDNNKFNFKAISSLVDPPVTKTYKWFVKNENETDFTTLTGKNDEITHTFLKDENYNVKVQMVDLNGKPITENTISVDVKNSLGIEDEAKKAYENKDWKKLFELYNSVTDPGDKRIVYDYIEKLAKEFNTLNEKDLETLKAYKTKNDTAFNNFKTAINNAISKNKDSSEKLQKLDNCLKTTKTKYEKENQKIEKAITLLEGLIKDYKTQKSADKVTKSYFENNENTRKTLGYDLSKPLPEPKYDTSCIPGEEEDLTEEKDDKTQKPDDKKQDVYKPKGDCKEAYDNIVNQINQLNDSKKALEKLIKENEKTKQDALNALANLKKPEKASLGAPDPDSEEDLIMRPAGEFKFKPVRNNSVGDEEEEIQYSEKEKCLNDVLNKSDTNIISLKKIISEINTNTTEAERIKELLYKEMTLQNNETGPNIVTNLEGEDPFAKPLTCKNEQLAINYLTLSQALIESTKKDLINYKAPADCNSLNDPISQEEAKGTIVSLEANKTELMCKDKITFTATTDGEKADKFRWEGYPLDGNLSETTSNTITFDVNDCHSFSMVVKAVKDGKIIGKASKDITVNNNLPATISGLSGPIYFGTSKNLTLSIKSNDENPIPSDATIVWNSSPNLIFDPEKSSSLNTTVTFDRMDNPTRIWAEIIKDKKTIGESEQIEVEVISPEFSFQYEPPANQAKIGQPVTVTILSKPTIDDSLIDYRWVEPTDRKELGKGKIEIIPKDTKAIKLHAIARVPNVGDTINDSIKNTFTAQDFEVTATVKGPKFDRSFKVWNKKTGMVETTKEYAIDQQILLEANTKGVENVNYKWSVNEECSIAAGVNSKELTISRHEVGTCTAKVVASDKDGRKLGEASVSLDITISQEDLNMAEQAQKDKLAREKLEEAKKLYNSGKIDEAITKATEASTLAPKNADIKTFITTVKTEKGRYLSIANEAKILIDNNDLTLAENKLAPIPANFKLYEPIKTIIDLLTQKQTEAKSRSEESNKKLVEAKKDYNNSIIDEAIEKAEDAANLDPKKIEAKNFYNKVKSEKERYMSLASQAKGLIKQDKLDAARAIFAQIPSNFLNYPPIKEIFESITQAVTAKNKQRNDLTKDLNTAIGLSSQCKYDEAINMTQDIIQQDPYKDTQKAFTEAKHSLQQFTKNKATLNDLITKAKADLDKKDYKSFEQNISTANSINKNCSEIAELKALAEKKRKESQSNFDPVVRQTGPDSKITPPNTANQTRNNIVPIAPTPNGFSQGNIVPIAPTPNGFSQGNIVPIAPNSYQNNVVPIAPNTQQSYQRPTAPTYTPQNTLTRNQSSRNIKTEFDSVINSIKANQRNYNQARKHHSPINNIITQILKDSSTDDTSHTSNANNSGNSISSSDFSNRIKDHSQKTYTPPPLKNTTPSNPPCITSSSNSNTIQNTNNTQYPITLEYGTDRNAHDYKSFFLSKADPKLCAIECYKEDQCKAFVFVKPGVQGPQAKCWLKHSIPPLSPNANCISGVKNTNTKSQQTSVSKKQNTQGDQAPINRPPASIIGNWYVNACGYSGNLVITGSGGAMTGKINYHTLNSWENIVNIRYNSSTGQVSFQRQKYPQTHSGKVVGNRMSGSMTRDDTRGNAMCNWDATRTSGGNTSSSSPSNTQRTSSLQSSQSSLIGRWQINANNYTGTLEISSTSGALSARIYYDVSKKWELLADVRYNSSTGDIYFRRPWSGNPNFQLYTGKISGNSINGTFKDYNSPNKTYYWKGTKN